LRYRPNTDVVLNKVSFKCLPGEKIGVVGRTGAGKSTLTQALTRIVEIESGKITIQNQDIKELDMDTLRKSLTMIPQDPTLFKGTLRYNIDPFNESTDEQIIELLNKAGLQYLMTGKSEKEKEEQEKKEMAEIERQKNFSLGSEKQEKQASSPQKQNTENGAGLDFKIMDLGKNLSIGEKQLICIVRAILRRNKIVILDEATSNIDVITEQRIQKLIQEEFKDSTTITIAHRLNTIIKSDKILFLDQGKVLEFDSPKALQADPNSKFSGLLKEL